MLRLAVGIVFLALPPHDVPAQTFPVADALSEDTFSIESSAAPAIREQSVAPEDAIRAPATAAPIQERELRGNPIWAVPLTALSSTRDRPIFSSSRRPPVPAVAAAPVAKAVAPAPKPPEPERPQLALVGTIATSGTSFGIFLNPSTKTDVRLKTGDYYQGWRLASVHGREATLEKDQETVTLALPLPGAGPPAGNVPPPPSNASRLLSAVTPVRRERSGH
ncbi:hypothetical protein ACFFWD_42515 [Bradyrhizobium erythrophlei]|uniref:hypothetical protein n=1 Tax=Bradyrhizobium erythrophlei TaxID=1437360 RepID=UPI0035EA3427